jgi:hypothetical protein
MPFEELLRQRELDCRLTPDRALETLDEAEAFLRDRGLLTLMPDCSLPSLFGACHEEPYKPGSSGFGLWPRTKYPWAFELSARCVRTKLHRGKGLFLSDDLVAVVDPLCRAELVRAEQGHFGPEAQQAVERLAQIGPALPEELELGRRTRERLERAGAVVSRSVAIGPHGLTSELLRWDQVRPEPGAGGGLDELVIAGVRAAVVVPEREAGRWFSWMADVARLVEEGRLVRPEPGWVAIP